MSGLWPSSPLTREAGFQTNRAIFPILIKETDMKKLSTTLLATFIALGSVSAFAADDMKKDGMAKDSMSKDAMGKDAMKKDPMSKDAMKKDSMGKDAMAKGDGMMKKDEMKK